MHSKMKQTTAYDVILVLGAQVRPEGVPSEALRRRLALAHARYLECPVPIICCGAQGTNEPMPEGDFMCAWLAEKGVPGDMLLSENKSFDTIENIKYAKVMMDAHGLTRALVVTSDYHVPRALAICRRYGIPAVGAGSESVRSYWLKNHLREMLAWGKFMIMRSGRGERQGRCPWTLLKGLRPLRIPAWGMYKRTPRCWYRDVCF